METLKISDLSVGDWVYYGNETTPYSIRSIYCKGIQDCVVLNDEKFSDGVIAIVDRLTPIPITSEILEKNGFEFEKASRWHICELEDKTRINVWIGRNNEGRIEVSKPDLFDDGYHFKYADIEVLNIAVHQLQDALRLAGVDKEIVEL
jgi:hypothetical protein